MLCLQAISLDISKDNLGNMYGFIEKPWERACFRRSIEFIWDLFFSSREFREYSSETEVASAHRRTATLDLILSMTWMLPLCTQKLISSHTGDSSDGNRRRSNSMLFNFIDEHECSNQLNWNHTTRRRMAFFSSRFIPRHAEFLRITLNVINPPPPPVSQLWLSREMERSG